MALAAQEGNQMAREYFLEDPLHPKGGIRINVKFDRDCVFCKHCTDVYWDYTNLIYMLLCDLGNDTDCFNENGEHICKDYEDEEADL